MSVITFTSTVSDFLTPSPAHTFTFTTSTIQTLVPATPGQTITLGSPNYAAPTTFFPTQTYTVTEYDVYLAGPKGNIWTSLTVGASPTEFSNPGTYYVPGEKVFVVACSGWNCWSAAAKDGLITGAILGVLILLLLLCCLRRWHERNIWISHGPHGANDYDRWQNSHPGWGYGGPPRADLHTGWGLRPYVTPAQAEAALRGGSSGPASAPKAEAKKEGPKKAENKGTRQKLGAWIAG